MTDPNPSKADIESVFARLRAIPHNKVCFDCGAKLPTWSSVTFGVFLCIDCSAVHRSLGVHLSFVRSTQLDTSWTWRQLRNMQLGGNANAMQFFRQHNLMTEDARQKYSSRVANMYKDKLAALSDHAMKAHGTKLHLDAATEPPPAKTEKEVDFFEEHASDFVPFDTNSSLAAPPAAATAVPQVSSEPISNDARLGAAAPSVGPSVTLASSASADAPHVSTIGQRKQQPKRTSLGARKGGLGAKKVSANDALIIERAVARAEENKTEESAASLVQVEKEAASLASSRLTYSDPRAPGKQKADVERLGIAATSRNNTRTGVSHSAMSDMQTIEQEGAAPARRRPLDDFDEFTSTFNMISSEPISSSLDDYAEASRRGGGGGGRGALGDGLGGGSNGGWEMIEAEGDSRNVTTMFSVGKDSAPAYTPTKARASAAGSGGGARGARRADPADEEETAVKKFGSAKGISSSQFFGDASESRYEKDANLNRFQGSTSISSADYFGTPDRAQRNTSVQLNAPDLEDVKESVRAGVTKVAGKLSSLANGMMSSIQDRYGY